MSDIDLPNRVDKFYPKRPSLSGIVLPVMDDIDLPICVDLFYPNAPFRSGKVLPIPYNQRFTSWFMKGLG